jgi:hypothetical protein
VLTLKTTFYYIDCFTVFHSEKMLLDKEDFQASRPASVELSTLTPTEKITHAV